jgi:UDP:flavonoid glycosyltransferase YjiC (YdhE family)
VRVLLTTLPGVGHLHPLLPVAGGLLDRGHDLLVAASSGFGAEVAGAGLDLAPVGAAYTMSELPARFPDVGAIPPGPDRYAYARAAIFARAMPLDVVPDLVALIDRWRPDLVVREAADYSGYLAAELAGVPHAMVRSDSGSASYADRGAVAAALEEVRATFGLPSDPTAERAFDGLQLSFAPPVLDDPPHQLPATWQHIRPTAVPAGSAPRWLTGVASHGDPIVYATLGTVHRGPEALATIIEAVAPEPVQLVVTTGGLDSTLFGRLPGNVHVESWIPQAALLPHCAAVVSHGGYGTVAAALAHGRPLVLLPISADQPLNAARCTAARVGIAIGPDERAPRTVRRAVRTVLDQPDFAIAAARARAEADAQPDLHYALDRLEALAMREPVGPQAR